jgi:lysophospholipase L1-like esterase
MKNKSPKKFKTLLSLILTACLFVLCCYILKHCFNLISLSHDEGKKYYNNDHYFIISYFGGFIRFLGSNAVLIFYFITLISIVIFSRILYNALDRKSDFKIYISVIFVLLIICELILRIFHFQPGIHTRYKHFQPVSNLWTYKSFVADKNGILRVSSDVANEVSMRIFNNDPNYSQKEYGEIYGLIKENIELKNRITRNALGTFYYRTLKKKKKNDLDSAIINYISNPINSDGFRGIEMKKYNVNKESILLLGDSFAWGHSAMPKSNSFADLLLTKGYIVYNTGISATDVTQYLVIAREYIKKLKPDFVIVNFYLGNDITYYQREVIPFHPVFYCTNAGNIYYFYDGKYYMTKEEAYNFVLKQITIPGDVCILNKIMSKSVITSLCWGILNKTTLIPFLNEKHVEHSKYKNPYCNIELMEIESLCNENGSKFILSSIPELYYSTSKFAKNVPNLFTGLKHYEMKVEKSDYNLDDGHFNVQGHRKYAAFLDRIIKSKMK